MSVGNEYANSMCLDKQKKNTGCCVGIGEGRGAVSPLVFCQGLLDSILVVQFLL